MENAHALKNVGGSALPAYEVAFGKHRAAFQLAGAYEAYSNRPEQRRR